MKPNRRAKKADASSKLILEEIIGLTTKNCNGLASNTSTSNCAYVAGCVVVVYNVDSNTQSHLMVSHRMPKPLSCVTMSSDGRFIAAGESGTQPAVIVWDSANLAYICELKGHLFGVECIDFSPDGEHLVSVGGYIYLWDWRNATLATKIKATSSCSVVTSVRFSLDSRFIVTAGKKHLKFWTVGSLPETRLNKGKTSLSMHAKPVNLGLQKGSSFVSIVNDVRFGGKFPIYALTDTGVLCLVHSGLSVTKTVDLKVEKSFAVSASDKLIACACSNGAVQLFTIESLEYAGTLHYAKSKNCNRESELDPQPPHTHLDAIACNFSTYEKLVVVYGDRSFYVWDVHDVNQATRCCVLVSHSACIWDVKNLCCENMHNPSLACVGRGCCGGVSFSTCSADGTIRLWDLGLQNSKDDVGLGSSNIGPVGATRLVSRGIFERDIIETSISAQGFRSMAVSSDGKYLAAGDSDGNLHIFDLRSSAYTCIKDAHDAEILSLSFSEERHVAGVETMGSHYFLASGGRDRTIHLYDVKRNFDLVESIEDHSAAVTSVKFTCDGYKILSCSADRSLVFRDVAVRGGNYKISRCNYQLASLGTVYDMVVDPRMEVVVTVGQDKKINSFNIAAGKLIRSLKQDKDLGDPIKVTMDPSGSYLVCSYSNKSICLYDFITGEMVSQAVGHGEVITSVIFLADCKHIVSVGGDGCIFVWKVPARFSSRMLQKVNQIFGTLSPRNFSPPITLNDIVCSEEEVEICRVVTEGMSLRENLNQIREGLHHLEDGKRQQTSAFRFSISRLPKWAQAKVTSPVMIPSNPELASFQKQLEAIKSSPSVDDVDDAYACSEVQSPSNHDLRDNGSCLSSLSRSSDAETNARSTLSKKNASGFALDNRWLNVYTVCQDLPNSPEMQCTKDGEMPVSSLNLFQQVEHLSDGATTNEHATPNNMGNNQRIMQDQNVQSKVVSGVAERSNSDKTKVQENVDYNVCCEESDETDLFKQHFGSLSTTHKIEKRKSSGRRRFSAQYVLRREYTGDSNRLFDTPLHSGGSDTLKFREECFSHVPSESPGPQTIDSTEQEVKKLTQSSNPSSQNTEDGSSKRRINGDSVNMELMDATQCEEHILEGGGMVKNTSECKEALRNLESAAENVVQIFSGLRTMASREEHSSGPETEIYDEAAKLLPSIAEKINAVAKMVQQRNVDLSERTAMQVSGLEPLLGTFA